MNGTFVPLSANRASEEFLAVSDPAPLKSAPTVADATSTVTAGTSCGIAARREPVLELIRDGSRVSHLKITCACGEVITVECQF